MSKRFFFFLILLSILLLSILSAAFFRSNSEQPKIDKIYGIYISKWTMDYPQRCLPLLDKAKAVSLNTVVCDFEGTTQTYLENFNYAGKLGLYRIARIVVFEEGLGATYQTAEDPVNWQKKLALSKEAEQMGFDEIQYDYIRFSDRGSTDPRKKDIVEKFLIEARATLNIPVGVDVFGSVAYQPHHIIGQDLERMAKYIDVVSPMLYPSHFYNDTLRLSKPYRTMLEGSTMGKNKLRGTTVRMIPYIQGFAMNLGYAQMDLYTYIKEQLRACEDAGTDGFYIWHSANDYGTTFAVLQDYGALYQNPPKSQTEIYEILGITTNALLY